MLIIEEEMRKRVVPLRIRTGTAVSSDDDNSKVDVETQREEYILSSSHICHLIGCQHTSSNSVFLPHVEHYTLSEVT